MTTPAPSHGFEGGRLRVEAALGRQRDRDLLGPEGVEAAWDHSLAFAEAVGFSPARALDLGSGGGIPGLVLASAVWTRTDLVLLDGNQRRCTALEVEVEELDLLPRVRVHWARAEEAGRDPELRGGFEVVVARSFGPPAVTAECAAPLLRHGGTLVVSEPPGDDVRWPDVVPRLGLVLDGVVEVRGRRFARLFLAEPCPEAYPRRPGVPERRPLF